MIDVNEQINAVRRQVGSRVLAAGEMRTMAISQSYHADISDVWDAVTNPDRIRRWFVPVEGDLRVGGRYQVTGNASGTIETCDPPKGFAATWEYGEHVSWIEVTLRPEAPDRTRLELVHIAPGDDEHWATFGPGAVGVGWDMALMGLSRHMSSAQAVDPAEAAGWVTSGAGRQFMTLSSEHWRDAHIEAGADKAAAAAAADRVIAAYTGGPTDAGAQ